MYIGVTGYARAGKNTVANRLTSHWDFKEYSLADGVREALLALNPIVNVEPAYGDNVITETLSEVLDSVDGWDDLKDLHEGPEIRRLLQRMGTEAGRNLHGDQVWINRLMRRISLENEWPASVSGDFVIPDVRFNNEAGMCDYVIEVKRPGVGPANGHASEVPVDRHLITYTLLNDKEIGDLNLLVDDVMRQLNADYDKEKP